jgi:hypothetical protein
MLCNVRRRGQSACLARLPLCAGGRADRPGGAVCRVDGGVPLRVALADLEAWLREQGLLGQVGRGRPLEATELPAHPAATPASMPGCCASLNSHSLSSRASWPPL